MGTEVLRIITVQPLHQQSRQLITHSFAHTPHSIPHGNCRVAPTTSHHSPPIIHSGTGLDESFGLATHCYCLLLLRTICANFTLLTVLQRSASAAFVVSAIPKRLAIARGQCARLGLTLPTTSPNPRASLLNIPPRPFQHGHPAAPTSTRGGVSSLSADCHAASPGCPDLIYRIPPSHAFFALACKEANDRQHCTDCTRHPRPSAVI